jgi:hypothetical protein
MGYAHRYDIAPLWGWEQVVGRLYVVVYNKLLKIEGVRENDFYWQFQLTLRNNWNNGLMTDFLSIFRLAGV